MSVNGIRRNCMWLTVAKVPSVFCPPFRPYFPFGYEFDTPKHD